ncbi:lysophospholipid acyltransferase family protein [Haloplasma contractile]|uniref:1-acyl-sn-glycerol-3-phosphate acyltransferase protein n=1 Tax=Haloplasma contractile SSD-17B TaxID=1033810 RepID=U2EE59_9MOLU|nr:lysophospholipid acyltransferase family protein [Haloplasma contractile]ERJ13273.1 1-acyl-sn-glycerol-3-phosphate acyltransferase protein [Haloplasma contractile SSD-17B]
MSLILKGFANASRILPKNIRISLTNKLIDRILDKYSEIDVINKEIIEKRRGVPTIYIGNHLSNIDGVILNKLLKNNDVAFMAGVKLSKNKMTNLILDTTKTIHITPNSVDKKAIKEAINYLKDGGSIFIFPEGTRSRSSSMIKAKKGFVLLAKMSKAALVPVGVEGTEQLLPINSDSMSKENFNHSKVKVTFGEPFNLPEKTKENKVAWTELATEYSMKKIAKLLDSKYRGIYK